MHFMTINIHQCIIKGDFFFPFISCRGGSISLSIYSFISMAELGDMLGEPADGVAW